MTPSHIRDKIKEGNKLSCNISDVSFPNMITEDVVLLSGVTSG